MHRNCLLELKIIKYFFLVYLVFSLAILYAQQPGFQIRYVGQVSAEQDLQKEKSIISTFSDFIFGDVAFDLQKPISIIADNNNLWITDQDNNSIMSIKKIKDSFYDIKSDDYIFQSLVGVCLVGKDTVLFSDSKLNELFWFEKDDPEIHHFEIDKELNMPTGIAYNPVTGEIWIAETGGHHLVLMNSKGVVQKIIGERGLESGQFNFPNFIWIDHDGVAYVVDAMNFRVQIFDADGNFISMFGEAGDASGYLARPKGIATDSYGNIYVVDALFNTVQIFDRDGNYLYNFGKKGSGKEEFMLPMGIFIDKSDQIYVADSYNQRVQIFKISRESAFENSDKN